MYKVSYSLAKINQYLAVDVTIYIQNDDTMKLDPQLVKNKEAFKTIRKFNIDGNTYIKFSPKPFIDLTIDPDIKDKYDPIKRIRCNRFDIYKLIRALDKMVNTFRTTTDLFYYYGNKLILDDTKLEKATIILPLRDRTLKIVPTIIQDVDTGKQHEGIIIYVNSENVSCPMTYMEMEFLLYLLKTTDIDNLATSLYSLDNNGKFNYDKKVDDYQDINQEPISTDNTVTYATPKNGSTIPNI